MPAKSVDLDALDRQILAVLQEDARRTNRAIAAQVGSSEATVRRRVDRLLNEGLIRIAAVASPFALGYQVVAILGLQLDRSYQRQVEQALHGMPEVRFVGLTLGSYDAILEVWLASTDALLAFLTDQISPLPGLQRVEAWQVLKLSKYSYDWGEQPAMPL
jgi:Lrp/AsnC family transcriptional regulator for asnA, asnC and gidA